MKILLFFSGEYFISRTYKTGFEALKNEVKIVNYLNFIPFWLHNLDLRAILFPNRLKNNIRNVYLKKIQEGYLQEIKAEKPDLVLVYNDQMLDVETAKEIKKRGAKLAIFLADSPFFLQRREHLFKVLFEADLVFAPDSYWLEQINMLGIRKTTFLISGYDETTFFPTKKKEFKSDLIYIGSPYNTVWGFKRAFFLNHFTNFNFNFYGPTTWNQWLQEYPKLKNHYIAIRRRLSDEEVNFLLNSAKIYPVDANPGLINGIHVRILDCIGAGILPIVEYRKDIEIVFKDAGLPIIYEYGEYEEIINYYLGNDSNRVETIERLRDFVLKNYNSILGCKTILEKLF